MTSESVTKYDCCPRANMIGYDLWFLLSAATVDYDRQSKFRMYRTIQSFSEYLLVEQDEPFVERYIKQTQGWLLREFQGLEGSIFLESVGKELAIAEIYRGVVFE